MRFKRPGSARCAPVHTLDMAQVLHESRFGSKLGDQTMRLILAMDGSTESLAAVKRIEQLPWPEPPDVTVVSALVDTPYKLMQTQDGPQLRKAETEAATKNFEDTKQRLNKVCSSVELVLDREHPRRLILDVAKKLNADTIVLGARGHGAAYRVVVGSTADYVVNHASCSVLIVRDDDSTSQSLDAVHRILVPYDGSAEAVEASPNVQVSLGPAENAPPTRNDS
ncbi:MAG TPA: hypothetical protein DDW52_03190 [Planctomycetaceae bacterium]|nr:hypothetical protein [Planctomycetaceae bacterium]